MEELETALAQQAPPPPQDDPSLYELPPLVIDGIPTPVEKMTQAQLRAFIPLMLKYSTGEYNFSKFQVSKFFQAVDRFSFKSVGQSLCQHIWAAGFEILWKHVE